MEGGVPRRAAAGRAAAVDPGRAAEAPRSPHVAEGRLRERAARAGERRQLRGRRRVGSAAGRRAASVGYVTAVPAERELRGRRARRRSRRARRRSQTTRHGERAVRDAPTPSRPLRRCAPARDELADAGGDVGAEETRNAPAVAPERHRRGTRSPRAHTAPREQAAWIRRRSRTRALALAGRGAAARRASRSAYSPRTSAGDCGGHRGATDDDRHPIRRKKRRQRAPSAGLRWGSRSAPR